MGKLKDLLEKPKQHIRFKKQIHQKKISRYIGNLCKARKGKLGKVRVCEIELANNIKDSKQFFQYFSNNKKQKSNIGPMLEEGNIIYTY